MSSRTSRTVSLHFDLSTAKAADAYIARMRNTQGSREYDEPRVQHRWTTWRAMDWLVPTSSRSSAARAAGLTDDFIILRFRAMARGEGVSVPPREGRRAGGVDQGKTWRENTVRSQRSVTQLGFTENAGRGRRSAGGTPTSHDTHTSHPHPHLARHPPHRHHIPHIASRCSSGTAAAAAEAEATHQNQQPLSESPQ
jgi:hypothetical protein